jgi:hypothetical protein
MRGAIRKGRLVSVLFCGVCASLLLGEPVSAQTSDVAFQRLLWGLESAGQIVMDNTSADGTDRAEGFRHVLRLVEMNLSKLTDDADPAHPIVTRCPSKVCKLGFDNPDFVYVGVDPISDQYTYRVFGKRGTTHFITFQVFNEGLLGGGDALESDELVVAPDGSYEIYLSPTPQPGNWLETTPTTDRLVIRHFFNDWDNEVEPSVQVEVIGDTGSTPVPVLTPERFSDNITSLARNLQLYILPFQVAKDIMLVNQLGEPQVGCLNIGVPGFPSNLCSTSRYSLGVDEALIIESPATTVKYRNIQLGNAWLESLDYATRQTSLNGFQSYLDSDNVYRYVVAQSDPGVPNWLDITGRPEGTIFMRWQSPPAGDLPPAPNAFVVPLAQVRDFLPLDHPTVTPAERGAALEARTQAYNRRTNPAGLAPGVEDYKCWKVKDLKNPKFEKIYGIRLDDQFRLDSNVDVVRPFMICNPADQDGTGGIDSSAHQCCYRIKGRKASPPRPQVEITDRFGTLQLEAQKPQLLCRPCSKTEL